jgi:hypothetical protein
LSAQNSPFRRNIRDLPDMEITAPNGGYLNSPVDNAW